jgi:hypothetical protein
MIKYINKNGFPIYIPDGRGGQTMFRSGEGSTHSWFARFVGDRQLSREDNTIIKRKTPVKLCASVEQKNMNVNIENIDALAQAVAAALEGKMNIRIQSAEVETREVVQDQFDASRSDKRMADAMTTQTQERASNIKDFKRTTSNKKDVSKTVDLLAELD